MCALTLFCGAIAHAQTIEDAPLSDPAVPALTAPPKTPKPVAKPTPKPKPTAQPAPTPRPKKTQSAPAVAPKPTTKPAPTPTAPPLESAPIPDAPLEDAPIPDSAPLPVQPGAKAPAPTANAATANSVENAPLEDAPIPDSAPGASGNATENAIDNGAAPFHRHDDAEPIAAQDVTDPNAFLWQAFYAGALVALMCSFLGLYVVTRRMVFIGVALAEISSAGIALSLLIAPLIAGSALAFLAPHLTILCALGFMLVGVLLLSIRWAPRGLPPDAPVGVFYLLATATGILMIAKSAQGEGHMLTLLRGDVLAVYPNETLQMAIVFAVLALIHALFSKEFLLVSLDRDAAATQGYRAGRWDFLLLLTIGVAVALSIRSVGVLLTAAMLIFPAATALLAAPRWKWAAWLAPITGVVAVALGLWLSLVGDFPASAVIVAILFLFLLPVLLWKTVRR